MIRGLIFVAFGLGLISAGAKSILDNKKKKTIVDDDVIDTEVVTQ